MAAKKSVMIDGVRTTIDLTSEDIIERDRIRQEGELFTAETDDLDTEIAASPLDGITFVQVDQYIEKNVIDLPTAKEAMKKLGRAILILNKRLGL